MDTVTAISGTGSAGSRFLKGFSPAVAKAITMVSMAGLLIMAFLLTGDGIGRYLFKAPINGAQEVVMGLLTITVFAGVAYTWLRKGHTRVTIITDKMSAGTRAVVFNVTNVLVLGLLFFATWQTVLRALRSWSSGEVTGALRMPLGPFMLVAALGCALLFLVVLHDVITFLAESAAKREKKLLIEFIVATPLVLLLCAAVSLHWLPITISPVAAGIGTFVILVPALVSGMPIGFVLMALGFLGMSLTVDANVALNILGQVPFAQTFDLTLSVIPLFVLMGELVFRSGISTEIFDAAHKFMGKLPGGLASATVGASGIFATVCGSTIATAVTVGTVALPEMKRYNYSPKLSTGSIASGGILGCIIPPSGGFVLYGAITENSIGRLFISGIVPGILIAIVFIALITIMCRRDPTLAPAGQGSTTKEKLVALRKVWPVAVLFLLVIGGIYTGIFTVTEAAGLGTVGALAIGFAMRRFTWAGIKEALLSTIVVSCMIFVLLIGARVISPFMALSGLPQMIATVITTYSLSPYVVIAFIAVVLLLLGCVMPAGPAMVLIVPIVYPTVMSLGFDPIWFGCFNILIAETGAITPPVAINVFATAAIAPEVPMGTIYRGVIPFIYVMVVIIGLLVVFPQMALWLPNMMKGA